MKMKPHRRCKALAVLWLLMLVLSLVGAPTVLAQGTSTSSQILPNLDLILIVDESDSMWRTSGTGILPADRVKRAVEILIDAFGADTLGSDFRVGIIVYGNDAQLAAPLTSLRQPQSQALLKEAFYKFHGPRGWTDAEKALKLAAQHLTDAGRANYKPAVILLSDGLPETELANDEDEEGRKQLPEYLDKVKAAFREARRFKYTGDVCRRGEGAPFYTVGIGAGTTLSPYWGSYQSFLGFAAGESGGSYFPEPKELSRLPFIFLQIFGELNCVPVGEPKEAVPGDVLLKAFDAYAEFLLAVVAPDGTARVTASVLRPDGAAAEPDGDGVRRAQSDLDQVWGVRRSPGWAGEWRLRLTGNSPVRYLFIPVSDRVTVDFLSPAASTHPVGKPLPITARLLDSRSQPVREGITQFEVDVVNPLTRSREGVPVKQEGAEYRGRYDKTLLANKTDLGQRDITVRAGISLEGQVAPVEGIKRLNLVTRPWLEPVNPSPTTAYPSSAPAPLAVNVRLADRLDPTTAQTAAIQAAIFRGDQQMAGPLPLKLDTAAGEARVTGQLPANALPAGRYRVVFTLKPSATAPDGDQAETELNLITVTPTPTATATPTPTPTKTYTPIPTPTRTSTPTPTPVPPPPPPPCWEQQGLWPCLPTWVKALLALLPLAVLAAVGIYISRLPTLDGMYFRSNRGPGEEYLRGGRLRPYKLTLGSVGGQPAVRLSMRAIRGEAGEAGGAPRLAQAVIEEVNPGAGQFLVGRSRYGAGESVTLEDGDQVAIGADSWTFHDPLA